jgi:DNA (cytosine-5)-methyltransferase 1
MKKYGKFKEKLTYIAEEESIYHARTEGDLLEDGKVRPKLIDLFAGAGGMTLGFTKLTGHIFQPVWANDFNDYAARTYNANFNDRCIVGDIVSILDDSRTKIPKADVVIGAALPRVQSPKQEP